jgi:phosphopantothenoylcysteine decarboxylase / phosphopantothenate---cysteine ligase
VVCLMTKSATQFVTPMTFRALSGNPVHSDPFSEGDDWNVLHTTLADQADLILMAPATADLIARLASGMADDLVTSVTLASRAKVLVVPAMNDNMLTHPITRDNMEKLKRIGYQFLHAIEGDLVCGRVGVGHIADQGDIVERVTQILK